MGETQTSPPTGNSHWQVDQGQPDCNQDREGQLTNITSSKGKKSKKLTSEAPPPLDHLQDHPLDQGMTSLQEI